MSDRARHNIWKCTDLTSHTVCQFPLHIKVSHINSLRKNKPPFLRAVVSFGHDAFSAFVSFRYATAFLATKVFDAPLSGTIEITHPS